MRNLVSLVLAVVVAGCVGRASSVAPDGSEASPNAATVTMRPSVTPVPSHPPVMSFEIPTAGSATVTEDGLRLDIEVGSVPLRPGVESWATMSLTNVGKGTVHFLVDGCNIPILAGPRLAGHLVEGEDQAGLLGAFKAEAIQNLSFPPVGDFTAEAFVGRDVACADVGIPRRIKEGATISQRALWEPETDVIIPDFPIEIVAGFRYDSRGADEEPGDSHVIMAMFPSAVLGGTPWSWITPADALDVALDDPEFVAWINDVPEDQPPFGASLKFEPPGLWTVQGSRELPPGQGWLAVLTIDATTGEIVERRFD
jgi:hypothetical protein